MNSENTKAQMRKGILEYCILLILSRNSCYASDLIRELREVKLIVVEGTLYPLLTRQKNAGLLSYRWEESQQGPPRKYYELTTTGRDYLRDLDASWLELVESINLIRK
jgi:PadR family transcriptional regulator, regulatory protein PadR